MRLPAVPALLLLAAWFLAACDERPAAAPSSANASPAPASSSAASERPPADLAEIPAWLDNGKPQSGLPRLRVFLGAHELDAELALTPAAIQKGMMWRTTFPETNAMLFAFGRTFRASFWMKNVPIDIDVAYLDPDGAILEIHKLERGNTNPVPSQTANVQFALETPVGWYQRHGVGPGVVVRTERGSLQETFFGARPGR